jgi:hypothetical protein
MTGRIELKTSSRLNALTEKSSWNVRTATSSRFRRIDQAGDSVGFVFAFWQSGCHPSPLHIRDLLWLAALVAVCVAWLSDRAQIARERACMVKLHTAYERDMREFQTDVAKLRADSKTLQELRLRAAEGK